jgi:CHASE2 domain-containing sensor protein
MKILIALAFVGILGALATAGVFMMRDGRDGKPKTGNMMRALAVRVALSVLLFVCILLAYWAGWIQPTGVPLGR